MPEYLAPGVYLEESSVPLRPIEGVATSTVGFLGATVRGSLKPTRITSFAAFIRHYGGTAGPGGYLPDAIRGFFANNGQRGVVARIVSATAATATATVGGITLSAAGPGAGGNRIWIRLGPATASGAFRVEAYAWDVEPAGGIFDPVADPARLPRPDDVDGVDGLSLDPDAPGHWAKPANREFLRLITMSVADGAALPAVVESLALGGGDDGDPLTAADFAGEHEDEAQRTGLAALALNAYRDVAIIYAPAASDDVVGAVVAHCEASKSCFAVIDAAPGLVDLAAINPRSAHATSFAAFYWPWLEVVDPASGARRLVPPGGHVCGVYARTDTRRGVWRAPAGSDGQIQGAVGLELEVGQSMVDALNPREVNTIRHLPDRGIVIWGARTLSEDSLWKYVNVRRLLIYIEQSIARGTDWVVFEPNGPLLWAAVRRSVENFLLQTFRQGALAGAKAEEAFYVRVGAGETMTQDDIENGRLIVEIGVAAVRPAEFVIFRTFGQAKGGDAPPGTMEDSDRRDGASTS